jgi:hypothetical protein
VLKVRDGCANLRRLHRHITVVVVLGSKVGVFQQLVRYVEDRRAVLIEVGSVADQIVVNVSSGLVGSGLTAWVRRFKTS